LTDLDDKRKPCILVAEDEPGLLRLFSEALMQEGFEVVAAENGESALSAARNHEGPIDLLITDVEMPKLDGFDLQERLRRERPDVRLLVISGTLDPNIGGTDFPLLRKPFLMAELADKVRQILGQSSGRQL
jgi:two-component system cell cycle sensor histidine kinase/response regulator CckA